MATNVYRVHVFLEWFQHLQDGRKCVEDIAHPGRSSMSHTDDSIEKMVIWFDRTVR